MRLLFGGILSLFITLTALAQATGDVESIGFDHTFRPGCWTPMVIRLTPTGATPFEGKIAVYQDDLDHDHAVFTRQVSLRGNSAGGGDKTQRFWMYFIPQPDLLRDGGDQNSVNRHLSVYLTTLGNKQVTRLLVQDPIDAVDSAENPRSRKLVLCVADQSQPAFSPYGQQPIGTKEDVAPAMIPIRDVRNLLPESALGYEGVDCIAWFDADPSLLSAGQRSALEQFVRFGGQLVVCQTARPNVWQMVTRGLAEMLPVEVQSIEKTKDLTALKRMTKQKFWDPAGGELLPTWDDAGHGPFDIATAVVKPGAVVDEYEQDGQKGRPYLVRGSFGMGTVTWVAQDLGDMVLTGRGPGSSPSAAGREDFKWMYIWDRILQWNNASQPAALAPKPLKDVFVEGYTSTYQMTQSFLAGMEFGSKSAGYLGVAILFFLIYWVAAGPGGYAFLASRKRSKQSWWIFAATAIVATVLTVLVVKVALRGPPGIKHVSFIRQVPGEPTWAYTQFGLYIPRDGGQTVALSNTVSDAVSYVTAYPSLVTSDEGAPPIEYEIPVFDTKAVTFPFRSTLKKLQALWIGDMPLGVTGAAHLTEQGTSIEGNLFNSTPRDLQNIYFIFRSRAGDQDIDHMLYVPQWSKQTPLDLAAMYKISLPMGNLNQPGDTKPLRTTLDTNPASPALSGWEAWALGRMSGDLTSQDHSNVPLNFTLLSLYDRLPPSSREEYGGKVERERFEMHRPALRRLDVSPALGAGRLIVLAESDGDGPMPITMTVDGDSAASEGMTYYQFVLPLDRSALIQPATQATRPTTLTSDKP